MSSRSVEWVDMNAAVTVLLLLVGSPVEESTPDRSGQPNWRPVEGRPPGHVEPDVPWKREILNFLQQEL